MPKIPEPAPCSTCGRYPSLFGYHVERQPPRFYCTEHRLDGERWLEEARQIERSARR